MAPCDRTHAGVFLFFFSLSVTQITEVTLGLPADHNQASCQSYTGGLMCSTSFKHYSLLTLSALSLKAIRRISQPEENRCAGIKLLFLDNLLADCGQQVCSECLNNSLLANPLSLLQFVYISEI